MRKHLVSILIVLCIFSGTAGAAKVAQAVQDAVKNSRGLIDVIITFQPGRSVDISSMGGKMNHDNLWVINGQAASLPADAINALTRNPNVKAITLDGEVSLYLDQTRKAANYEAAWAEGYSGAGITIAIVDTGISSHPDFADRLVAFQDFVNGKADFYDDNGHGTHCAGIAAGNGLMSDGQNKGPAYQASLVGVKVLNRSGNGSFSNVIAGIQWCIDQKDLYSIDIISLSLGTTATESHTSDPVCQAVEAAWNAGIVVCVAGGNDGPNYGTTGTPGIAPHVITVGATTGVTTKNRSSDQVYAFSSRGPSIDGLTKPDIVAPGTNIMSTRNADTRGNFGKGYYQEMSGTSTATPVIAGIAALVLEAFNTMTPEQVKSKLMATSINLGVNPNIQGAGLVDAYAATH